MFDDLKIEKNMLDKFLQEYVSCHHFELKARYHIMEQIEWLICRSQFSNILMDHFDMAFSQAIQGVMLKRDRKQDLKTKVAAR